MIGATGGSPAGDPAACFGTIHTRLGFMWRLRPHRPAPHSSAALLHPCSLPRGALEPPRVSGAAAPAAGAHHHGGGPGGSPLLLGERRMPEQRASAQDARVFPLVLPPAAVLAVSFWLPADVPGRGGGEGAAHPSAAHAGQRCCGRGRRRSRPAARARRGARSAGAGHLRRGACPLPLPVLLPLLHCSTPACDSRCPCTHAPCLPTSPLRLPGRATTMACSARRAGC